MSDKPVHNKHINEPLPTPDVPADEAWQQMHQLLVQHHLTAKPAKDKRRWLLWFCLLLFISISSIIGFLFYNNHADFTYKHKTIAGKENINLEDSNKTSFNKLQKNKQPSIQNTIVNNDASTKKVKDLPLHSETKFYTNADKQVDSINAENSITINNGLPGTISFPAPADSNTAKQDEQITSSLAATDSIGSNIKSGESANKKIKERVKQNKIKPEFDLQWNVNFSLTNNSHYFSPYNNKGHQYYMWLLPSLKAGINFNNKQSVSIIINPYKQQFAGNKIVHIEKPWIASVEPDIVTRLIKSRGIDVGLQYNHPVTKSLSINIGGSYMFLQNALFIDQSVESSSGVITQEKIYGAHKKDEAFHYLKSSFLNGDAALQYRFKKFSVGAGITVPLSNISADKQYLVRPLNGEFFLRYRFK